MASLVHYYEGTEPKGSRMIHMVTTFPRPKRDNHTNCGRPLTKLMPMPMSAVRRAKSYEPYRFCRKCKQLAGVE